jgi:peptide/nickel transport system permease protein
MTDTGVQREGVSVADAPMASAGNQGVHQVDFGTGRGKGTGRRGLVLWTFVENKVAVVGIVLIVLMVAFCFIGPLVYHTNQTSPNLLGTNVAPGGAYPLGSDNSGFDILGRLMIGGQSSIEVGFAVAAISTVVGIVYGALAGFVGGIVDAVMMRIVDVGFSIPVIFLFIFASRVFHPTLALLILLLGLISWLVPARIVRGETLALRVREYVEAVRIAGGRSVRIIVRHIVPNAIGPVVVTATFQVANAVLILATLQYLGFGLPPTQPTWGSMLSNGITYLEDGYWWEVYPALILIVLTVVAFNFVGDALQDAFQVRLQKR